MIDIKKMSSIKDYVCVIFLYLVFYLYSVHYIPEIIFPPTGTDPYSNWILAEIIRQRGIAITGLPAYFFTPIYAYIGFIISLVTYDVVTFFKIWIFLQITLFLLSAYYFKKLISYLISPYLTRLGFYLYCLYPPFIFLAMIPVKDILIISTLTGMFYNLFQFTEQKKTWRLVLSGIFLGLIINLRGNFCVLLIVLIVFLINQFRLRTASIFLIAVLFPILPFTARNIFVAHDAVLTNSVSGIHLYIGNNKNAIGTYTFLKDIRPSTFGHFYDAKDQAQQETGRTLSGSETSRFWRKKTWQFIRSNPHKEIVLLGKKFLLLCNNIEFASNYSFTYFKKNYLPFRFLNIPYNFGILFVFGLLGMFFAQFKQKNMICWTFGVVMCSMLTIFITGRYRAPLAFFLLISTLGFINALLTKAIRLTFSKIIIGIVFVILSYQYPYQLKIFDSKAKLKHVYSKHLSEKYNKLTLDKFMQSFYADKRRYIAQFTDNILLKDSSRYRDFK